VLLPRAERVGVAALIVVGGGADPDDAQLRDRTALTMTRS
jgi:hypothetical protein